MTVAFDQARGTDGTLQPAFDEMNGADGTLRPAYGELARWLDEVPPDVLEYRRREAEVLFRRIGITFAVYGEAEAQERLIPFDVIPRILSAAEWDIAARRPRAARAAPSTTTSTTSTAAARSSKPASSRRISCSTIRCSGRR